MDAHLGSPTLAALYGKLSEFLENGNAVTGTVVQKLR